MSTEDMRRRVERGTPPEGEPEAVMVFVLILVVVVSIWWPF